MRLLLAAALALLVVGCGSKKKPRDRDDDPPSRAAASESASPSDALASPGQSVTAEKIVDRDYRFTLERPEGQYRLLGEPDARALGIRASRAGFIGPGGLFGAISIDELPEIDLDGQLDDMLRSKAQAQVQIEERATITFAGVPARRIGLAVVAGNSAHRECHVVFQRGGFVYVIGATIAVTPAQPRGCGFLEPLLAKFTLDEGQPVARLPTLIPRDVIGTSSRLVGGAFESPAGLFRLKETPSARVVGGEDATALYGPAEVAVLYASPGAVLALRSDATDLPDPVVALDGYVAQLGQYVGAMPNGRTEVFSFLGRDLVMRELDAPNYEWWVGLDYVAGSGVPGRATLVAGWTPKGTRSKASALLRKTLADVEPLSATDAATIQAQIDATPASENLADAAYSHRRGVYRNFLYGLRWARPSGRWTVEVGPAAARLDPYALMAARSRDADVQCNLQAFGQNYDDDKFHKTLRAQISAQASVTWGKATKAKLDGRPAMRSRGGDLTRGTAYTLLTHAEPLFDMALFCFGPVRAITDHPEVIERFEQELRFDVVTAMDQTATGILDRQMGFSIDLPAPWTLRAENVAPRRAVLAKDDKARFVEVAALPSGLYWDRDFAVGYSISSELQFVGLDPTEDEPVVSDATLDGRPARRFIFQSRAGKPIECVTLRIDHLRYVVIAHGPGAYEEAVAGFKLRED